MSDEEQFGFEEDDYYAIDIAKNVARRFLQTPNLAPQKIVGLGNALYALDRMPRVTPGAYTEFGITYRAGTETFKEMRYIDFRICADAFEISIGGSVYDKSVGSDAVSEPGWLIEIGGYRNTACELYNLESLVGEYLDLGAEITVDDESNIEFEESEQ